MGWRPNLFNQDMFLIIYLPCLLQTAPLENKFLICFLREIQSLLELKSLSGIT